jgi:hypothetical protein
VAAYRLYCMDGVGRIHYAEPLEADDDEAAIERARELKLNAIRCEIWQDDRLVATLKADDLSASG